MKFSASIPLISAVILLAVAPTVLARETARAVPAHVREIRTAATTSQAIQAYAQAVTAHPDNPAILTAYTRRMVDLGLPDAAYQQAERLIRLKPRSGIAWAVAAQGRAKEGRMSDAVAAVLGALQHRPEDPFVLYTAGQLVGWYDHGDTDLQARSGVTNRIGHIRAQVGDREAFQQGYSLARARLESPAPPAEEAPKPPEPDSESLGSFPPPPSFYDDGHDDPDVIIYRSGHPVHRRHVVHSPVRFSTRRYGTSIFRNRHAFRRRKHIGGYHFRIESPIHVFHHDNGRHHRLGRRLHHPRYGWSGRHHRGDRDHDGRERLRRDGRGRRDRNVRRNRTSRGSPDATTRSIPRGARPTRRPGRGRIRTNPDALPLRRAESN